MKPLLTIHDARGVELLEHDLDPATPIQVTVRAVDPPRENLCDSIVGALALGLAFGGVFIGLPLAALAVWSAFH